MNRGGRREWGARLWLAGTGQASLGRNCRCYGGREEGAPDAPGLWEFGVLALHPGMAALAMVFNRACYQPWLPLSGLGTTPAPWAQS